MLPALLATPPPLAAVVGEIDVGSDGSGGWWYDNVVEPGKLPLLACAVAFVVTFAVTRLIVRMIRAGRGPFKNNTVNGVHVHHMVPGMVLVVIGGFTALGATGDGWRSVGGAVFGTGLALVLDEFALLLHLDDVYWSEQGRLSVDAVFLCSGVLVLLLLGWAPFGVDDLSTTEIVVRAVVMAHYGIVLVSTVVALAKGKIGSAVIGLLVPFVAFVAALRLARPDSYWARRRYGDRRPAKQARAREREERFDRRWRARVRRVQDLVAGSVDPAT